MLLLNALCLWTTFQEGEEWFLCFFWKLLRTRRVRTAARPVEAGVLLPWRAVLVHGTLDAAPFSFLLPGDGQWRRRCSLTPFPPRVSKVGIAGVFLLLERETIVLFLLGRHNATFCFFLFPFFHFFLSLWVGGHNDTTTVNLVNELSQRSPTFASWTPPAPPLLPRLPWRLLLWLLLVFLPVRRRKVAPPRRDVRFLSRSFPGSPCWLSQYRITY